jgi:hypothetical protein
MSMRGSGACCWKAMAGCVPTGRAALAARGHRDGSGAVDLVAHRAALAWRSWVEVVAS